MADGVNKIKSLNNTPTILDTNSLNYFYTSIALESFNIALCIIGLFLAIKAR